MPVRKRHPTRAEARHALACLHQLRAEGIDVEIPEAWQERSCPLEIRPGREFGIICELPRGGVGYAIALLIVAQSRLILEDSSIRSSWDDQIWLPPLEQRGPCFRLGPLEYLAKDVLNDRIEDLRFNFCAT
jgi:hypothetical protein